MNIGVDKKTNVSYSKIFTQISSILLMLAYINSKLAIASCKNS